MAAGMEAGAAVVISGVVISGVREDSMVEDLGFMVMDQAIEGLRGGIPRLRLGIPRLLRLGKSVLWNRFRPWPRTGTWVRPVQRIWIHGYGYPYYSYGPQLREKTATTTAMVVMAVAAARQWNVLQCASTVPSTGPVQEFNSPGEHCGAGFFLND